MSDLDDAWVERAARMVEQVGLRADLRRAAQWIKRLQGYVNDAEKEQAALRVRLEAAEQRYKVAETRIGEAIQALEGSVDRADVITILWPPDAAVAQRATPDSGDPSALLARDTEADTAHTTKEVEA